MLIPTIHQRPATARCSAVRARAPYPLPDARWCYRSVKLRDDFCQLRVDRTRRSDSPTDRRNVVHRCHLHHLDRREQTTRVCHPHYRTARSRRCARRPPRETHDRMALVKDRGYVESRLRRLGAWKTRRSLLYTGPLTGRIRRDGKANETHRSLQSGLGISRFIVASHDAHVKGYRAKRGFWQPRDLALWKQSLPGRAIRFTTPIL